MKSKVFWGLIGLNAVLLFMLAGNFRGAAAQAQVVHRPGDYLMIPCQLQEGITEAVMIVDTENGSLGAMSYDDSSGQMTVMPPITLAPIFNSALPSR
ncbi:MAG: hypothetical protein ABSF29_10805 [Tepidisphaeraceae bacterium]|jgi:hypothetical protein